jgi:uncharacterized membrane protein YdjX (TVP38/TMEM64 family)
MLSRRFVTWLSCAGLIALIIAGWRYFSGLEPDAVRQAVASLGPLAPVVLFVMLILQCVITPVPSEPLMMAAGYLYGARAGFVLAWAGVIVGAGACFALAQGLGRPVAERFVRAERLDAAEAWIGTRGIAATFATLLAIRMVAFTSFDVLSYACGLLGVPFAAFALATVLGAVPKVFAFTYAGAQLGERPEWLDAVIVGGTLGVLLIAAIVAHWARWPRPAL